MPNVERKYSLLTTHMNECEKVVLTEQNFANEDMLRLVAEEAENNSSIRTIIGYNNLTGEVICEIHKN